MPQKTPKPLPLSVLRPLAKRARLVTEYAQGTMGLEGQGVSREVVRKVRQARFREAVLRAATA